ncbi:serine/threonine protein kinase [Candidatus Dependentiae bacterium]|nr:serine/threonine protein kinase [Candidatus Dependentiae bacterium]
MTGKKYKFDRYEIFGKLGQGGMAIVYIARHIVLNRNVALKVLLPVHAKDKRIVDMFYTEAEAMAKLNHKYVVKIFDINQYGNHHYFAMEHIDGNTLKDTIKRGNLTGKEIIILFREICEAIRYIHDQGILHLDIKANNILQTKEGQIKITDFGIGKIEGKVELTKRLLVGTVEYMAPEQLRGEAIDKRTDLYSLGIVLYELLTGELPYYAPTKKELMKKKLREPPVDPITKNPFIPYRLGQVAMKLITLYPEDRFQSIEEVIEELNREEKLIDSESTITRSRPKQRISNNVQTQSFPAKKSKIKVSYNVKDFFSQLMKVVFLLFLLFVAATIFSDKIEIPVIGNTLIQIKLKVMNLFTDEPVVNELSILNKMEILKREGKINEVFQAGEEFVIENPDYKLTIYRDLFKYAKDINHDKKAIEYAEKLIRFPGSSEIEILLDLAEYFVDRGDKRNARRYYRKIIELSPDSAMGKYALKKCKELMKK